MADAAPQPDAGPEERITEEELRRAYEAELRRISASDLILQTVASLINVAAFRLGLAGGEEAERDLVQARDAIEGVRALLPILERSGDAQGVRQLREALSQLQLAYARELQGAEARAESGTPPGEGEGEGAAAAEATPPPSGAQDAADEAANRPAGPAESSGRLWVPGKG